MDRTLGVRSSATASGRSVYARTGLAMFLTFCSPRSWRKGIFRDGGALRSGGAIRSIIARAQLIEACGTARPEPASIVDRGLRYKHPSVTRPPLLMESRLSSAAVHSI